MIQAASGQFVFTSMENLITNHFESAVLPATTSPHRQSAKEGLNERVQLQGSPRGVNDKVQ